MGMIFTAVDEVPEVYARLALPDTQALAERLRSCLQESEPLPRDFTKLFHSEPFGFDTHLVPEAAKLYDSLHVKHEPLSLIPPEFETPLPPLQPAVFPPTLQEPPAPSLDQFDLDEQFASERVRLAQLTNKCSDDDLDFYVREAGEIVGITGQLPPERSGAKDVLEYLLRSLVNFKKLNPEEDIGGLGSAASPARGEGGARHAFGIEDVYQPTFGGPSAGPAGMGPAVAAGFHSSDAGEGKGN